jgi:hypothetical protein
MTARQRHPVHAVAGDIAAARPEPPLRALPRRPYSLGRFVFG